MFTSSSDEERDLRSVLGRLGRFLALFGAIVAAGLGAQWGHLRRHPFRLDPRVHTVITGNSIARMSIDPGEIAGSVNVAQSAERFEVSYYKLRYLLELHAGIERVVLGISADNFAGHAFGLSTDDRHRAGHANLGIYNLVTLADTWRDDDLDVRTFLAAYLRTALFNPSFYRAALRDGAYHPFIGGFAPRDGRRPNHDAVYAQLAQNVYGAANGTRSPISPRARRYLDRIVRLCAERGVELVLVHVPAHPAHHALVPESFRAYFAGLLAELARRPALRVLDLGHERLPDDHFYDHTHLNAAGARSFSRRLQALLLGG